MATSPAVPEPVTAQDLKDLNRAQYILNQLLPQLDKAKAAGRDVTELALRRDDLADQVALIKSSYFPTSQ